MRITATLFSIRRLCVIMGPLRIGSLAFAACGFLVPEAFYELAIAFACLMFFFSGVIGFGLIIFVPAELISDLTNGRRSRCLHADLRELVGKRKEVPPKVVRTYPVPESYLVKMEKIVSHWKGFRETYLYPALIIGFVAYYMRGYDAWFDFLYPTMPYGFFAYVASFAALGIPWFLLFGRRGKRCPYCLTPRTADTFDSEHYVCLHCHTKFVAESENESLFPAPADKP